MVETLAGDCAAEDCNVVHMNVFVGNVIDPLDVIEGASLQQLLHTLENSLLHPREVAKYGKTKRKDFPQGLCMYA